ncbi:hypothetical protein R2320_004145, partial [Cronobacter turicensis]|nr:hypothetical protein [Cronobacter turicensis]
MDNSTKESQPDTQSTESNKKMRTKLLQSAFLVICTLIAVLFLVYILILSFGSSIKSIINENQDFVIPIVAAAVALLTSMVLTIFLKGPPKSNVKYESVINKFADSIPFLGNALKMALLILKNPIFDYESPKENVVSMGPDEEESKKSVKNRLMAKLVIGASTELKNDITRFSSEK